MALLPTWGLALGTGGAAAAPRQAALDRAAFQGEAEVAAFLGTLTENDYLEMVVGDFREVDLDGDGRRELLTLYLGNRPFATWTEVKGLAPSDPQRYVGASSSFADFYESEVLPGLDRRLERLEAEGVEDHRREVLVIERAKVLRAVGGYPTAGLQEALEWAEQPDPMTRIFAAAILRDIDGELATEGLRELAADRDQE